MWALGLVRSLSVLHPTLGSRKPRGSTPGLSFQFPLVYSNLLSSVACTTIPTPSCPHHLLGWPSNPICTLHQISLLKPQLWSPVLFLTETHQWLPVTLRMKFRVLDQTHPLLSLIPASAVFYDSSVTQAALLNGSRPHFPTTGPLQLLFLGLDSPLLLCPSWPQQTHTSSNFYPSIPSQFGGSSLTLLSVSGTPPL